MFNIIASCLLAQVLAFQVITLCLHVYQFSFSLFLDFSRRRQPRSSKRQLCRPPTVVAYKRLDGIIYLSS